LQIAIGRNNQVRYHLPITGVLNHPTIVNASFKRKIFLYDKGDYESYRNLLSVVDWDYAVNCTVDRSPPESLKKTFD
jgi:hypothetical protein